MSTSEAPPPFFARLERFHHRDAGACAIWTSAAKAAGLPLLLVHSVNAAASACEVKPLYEHYEMRRPTFALELPGFGHSERTKRPYTISVMVKAILEAIAWVKRQTSAQQVDIIALSLSCEFVAAASLGAPNAIRTLGLISPTGFEKRSPVRLMRLPFAKSLLRATLDGPPWSGTVYRALMQKTVIRRFLEKTWGSTSIDEELLEYDWLLSRQPGAQHAPFSFIAGYLFSDEPLKLYSALKMPVWIGHGTRGDFVDYSHLPAFVAAGTARQSTTFETGAFPHFERLPAVIQAYEHGSEG